MRIVALFSWASGEVHKGVLLKTAQHEALRGGALGNGSCCCLSVRLCVGYGRNIFRGWLVTCILVLIKEVPGSISQ